MVPIVTYILGANISVVSYKNVRSEDKIQQNDISPLLKL